MGVETALIASAVIAGVGTAYSVYQGEQQKSAQSDALRQQENAQKQAQENATRQQQTQQQAMNKANAQSPDVGAIMSAATQAAKGGPAGTMLTGPGGVNPQDLSLGKSTLLGS